jgi:predicted RNA-binding Zn-ribbon protein involved in translation (DUF1610 family)
MTSLCRKNLDKIQPWRDIRCYKLEPRLHFCPHCHNTLINKKSKNRTAVGIFFKNRSFIPLVETNIYFCLSCGWWAVREFLQELECSSRTDEIIYPEFVDKLKENQLSAAILRAYLEDVYDNTPWHFIFASKETTRTALSLTELEIKWLFGGTV